MGGGFVVVRPDTVVVAGGLDRTTSFFHWQQTLSIASALSFRTSVKDSDRLSPDGPVVDSLGNVKVAMFSPDMQHLYAISHRDWAASVFKWDSFWKVADDPCDSQSGGRGLLENTQSPSEPEEEVGLEPDGPGVTVSSVPEGNSAIMA